MVNEWQRVNQWQYRGAGADDRGRGEVEPPAALSPEDGDGEPHIIAGAVTVHIANVERLEVRQSQPGPGADGKLPE